MAAEPKADLAVRPGSQTSTTTDNQPSHKHSRSLQSETARPAVSPSLSVRPAKRSMPAPRKTIAVINASGRQAASLIRYATAVGYHVRAQMRNQLGVIATEVATNPSVTVLEGELYTHHDDGPMEEEERDDNDDDEGEEKDEVEGEQELKKEKRGEEQQQQRRRRQRQRQRRSGAAGMVDATKDLSDMGVNHALISELFRGAELAFINTTFYGDEIRIGEALANAAKTAGVQHYVYSSMPDHAAYDGGWPSLPLWAPKHAVEEYARHIGLPATFVYTGIYNNNFTSLPYPLFCMELQPDGSFVWRAPFHPDARLPWLDAEHDIGPAILQIFKTGVDKWGHGRRIALAYEVLTPREACAAFARGLRRRVEYARGPIEIKVPIPQGYRVQLEALERLFGMGGDDPARQPPYFGDRHLEDDCPATAMQLWEGPRGLEEYAREVFPLEEQANGLTWMLPEDDSSNTDDGPPATPSVAATDDGGGGGAGDDSGNDNDDDDDEPLTMRATARNDEEWLP